jgi:hypothetical protein
MKFLFTILSTLVAAELVSAQIPILSEYDELYDICEKGGSNSVSIYLAKLMILN